MSSMHLRLYISGRSGYSLRALENIKQLCQDNNLAAEADLEVIDVLENPQQAEDEKILATPTLVKVSPPPLRRIVGDLSNRKKVLMGLGLGLERHTQEDSTQN